MWRKVLSELAKRDNEEMRRFYAAFDRHTVAFERLVAAFDRYDRRFELGSARLRAASEEPDWRDDPVAKKLARETDALIARGKARSVEEAHETKELIARYRREREESEAARKQLRERIDRLPPAQAA